MLSGRSAAVGDSGMRSRRTLRRNVFLAVILLLCAAFGGCRLYYLFFTVVSFGELGFTGTPAVDVGVSLTLNDIEGLIELNQAHLAVDDLEVAFGVRIDVDDNALTGDGGGYDIDISIRYLRYNSPTTGTSAALFEFLDPEFGETLFVSDPLSAGVVWAAIRTGTIQIFFRAVDPVFANYTPTCRTQIYSYYEPLAGPVEDTVAAIVGSGSTTDPTGNITPAAIDIVAAAVDFTMGGLQ